MASPIKTILALNSLLLFLTFERMPQQNVQQTSLSSAISKLDPILYLNTWPHYKVSNHTFLISNKKTLGAGSEAHVTLDLHVRVNSCLLPRLLSRWQ
jgi:hypothetical protein